MLKHLSFQSESVSVCIQGGQVFPVKQQFSNLQHHLSLCFVVDADQARRKFSGLYSAPRPDRVFVTILSPRSPGRTRPFSFKIWHAAHRPSVLQCEFSGQTGFRPSPRHFLAAL